MLRYLYNRFPELAPYPKEIEIEITTKCHLNCLICEHTYWKDQSRNMDITYDEFVKIANQFPDLRAIGLSGEGTVLLNKDFFRMLEYCKSRGTYVIFAESFDLLTETDIRKIIELRINKIELSMDASCKQTYEKIKKGAIFERTINNLTKLRELKKQYNSPFPWIFVRYIYNTLNQEEIVPFIRLISELDLNCGRKTVVQFTGILSFPEIEQYNLKELSKNTINEGNAEASKHSNIEVIWLRETAERPPVEDCARWIQPYIMIGGDVVVDCAVMMSNNRTYLKKTKLGNVLEKNFSQIWNDKNYKFIREAMKHKDKPLHPQCRGCRSRNTKSREEKFGFIDLNG